MRHDRGTFLPSVSISSIPTFLKRPERMPACRMTSKRDLKTARCPVSIAQVSHVFQHVASIPRERWAVDSSERESGKASGHHSTAGRVSSILTCPNQPWRTPEGRVASEKDRGTFLPINSLYGRSFLARQSQRLTHDLLAGPTFPTQNINKRSILSFTQPPIIIRHSSIHRSRRKRVHSFTVNHNGSRRRSHDGRPWPGTQRAGLCSRR